MVAGVIGSATSKVWGLMTTRSFKSIPRQVQIAKGRYEKIAKRDNNYRSAIIEVLASKTPNWESNGLIQHLLIALHTDNTNTQGVVAKRMAGSSLNVYYDDTYVYIYNNYSYTIDASISINSQNHGEYIDFEYFDEAPANIVEASYE